MRLLLFVFLILVKINYANCGEIARYGSITWADYPPYSMHSNEAGRNDGFKVDLIESAINDLGYSPEPVLYPSNSSNAIPEILSNVINGKIDIFSLPISAIPKHKDLIIIKEPTYHITIQVFVRSDRQLILNKWTDLKGLIGAHTDRSGLNIAGSKAFHNFALAELNITDYKNNENIAKALLNGDIDYAVCTYRPMLLQLRKMDLHETISPQKLIINEIPIHWFVGTKGTLGKHTKELENILKSYKKNGYINLLMIKAMRKYLSDQPTKGHQRTQQAINHNATSNRATGKL